MGQPPARRYSASPRNHATLLRLPLLGFIVLGLLGLGLTSPAQAAEDTVLSVPDTLAISGIAGEASIVVELPAGATPTALRGRIDSTYTLPGSLVVTVDNREVASVDTLTGGAVAGELGPDDVRDSALRLGLRAVIGGDDRCFDQSGVSAVLEQIEIVYQVPVSVPESVADFMVGAPRSVTVAVSPGSSAAVGEAALNAVTLMAKTFPRPTEVDLNLQTPGPANPGLDRVVVVTEGPEPEVDVVDGVLVVSGPPESLKTSVESLASDSVAILAKPSAVEPSADIADVIPALTSSLADLGKPSPSLSGVGIVESTFGVSQSDFGRSVSAVTLDLVGTATPVQGGEGRVNVLWNDVLVNSVPMTDDPRFATTVQVSGPAVQRDNSVTIQLEYLPRGGDCSLAGLPARLDVDGRSSTISATAGQSATGFEMFPQVLTATTPVTFGTQQSADDSLVQAGQLLASLQRLTGLPIDVELQEWDAFVGDSRPGVAIGIGEGEDATLGSLLRYAPFRTVELENNSLTAEVAGSFSALQAYLNGDRALLVLGGFGPNSPPEAARLATEANANPTGWFSLAGSIAVAEPGQEPVFLDPESLSAQPEQTAAGSLRSFQWLWWIAGLLLLALLVGVVVRLWRRRS